MHAGLQLRHELTHHICRQAQPELAQAPQQQRGLPQAQAVLLLVLLQQGQQQGSLGLAGCPLQLGEGPGDCGEGLAAAAGC